MNNNLYIGIMSGTSADGIDSVLVDFSPQESAIICSDFTPFDDKTRRSICALFTPNSNEIDRLGELDTVLGQLYYDAVAALVEKSGATKEQIMAAGLHGQTIRHRPDFANPFTLQIGNPYLISQKLGITVVNDFRRADIALGGQGAPLAPLFHKALFHSTSKNRVIVNIGGIANITFLPANGDITGFDTGPGNGLMDDWIRLCKGQHYDSNGEWAKQGTLLDEQLNHWLTDHYFQQPPPKSTGKEHFTLERLGISRNTVRIESADRNIQRTLCELTAHSIAEAIHQHCPETEEIWVCGGGANNAFLLERIATVSHLPTATTMHLGIDPNWVEAVGFAWLAKACMEKTHAETQRITGAEKACILGAIHPA